jgi:hypothetical protein
MQMNLLELLSCLKISVMRVVSSAIQTAVYLSLAMALNLQNPVSQPIKWNDVTVDKANLRESKE